MLEQVISGGQTGADRIALIAAKHCKIKTGGYAPKGFKTEKGYEPRLLTALGLEETGNPHYSYRTELNVLKGDGTILFGNMESVGSRLTIAYLKKYKKPYICNPQNPDTVLTFVSSHRIKILNVAGNRGSSMTDRQKADLLYFLVEAYVLCLTA